MYPTMTALGWELPQADSLSRGSRAGWIDSHPLQRSLDLSHSPSSPYWSSHSLYDLVIKINRATNLPMMDWYNGQADPYIIISFNLPTGQQLKYRTETMYNTKNPTFNEVCELHGVPPGTAVEAQVWDKDMFTPDEIIGQATYIFNPEPAPGVDPRYLAGVLPVCLGLSHPTRKAKGQLEIEISFSPSKAVFRSSASLKGPVKFREHMSPLAGALMGCWNDDNSLQYCTYKLFLCRTSEFFQGVSCPWNANYDKAVSIFRNPLVLNTVRTQHSSLYSTAPGMGGVRTGTLSNARELFTELKWGCRAGQRRYFTYVLLEDSLRFSETGAAFLSDMMSKHAMHAGAAEAVLMAGEFTLLPDPAATEGHRLVVDNNSGTYAPPAYLLPRLVMLLQENFAGISCEAIEASDPRLKDYHHLVPSR